MRWTNLRQGKPHSVGAVLRWQGMLNVKGVRDGDGLPLVLDDALGPRTSAAARRAWRAMLGPKKSLPTGSLFTRRLWRYLRRRPIHVGGLHWRLAVASLACRYIGTRYVWGGKKWPGIDCSGLSRIAYRIAGITLPHGSWIQQSKCRKVSSPKQSDLFFVYSRRRVRHVGLMVGHGFVVHARGVAYGTIAEKIQAVSHRPGFFGWWRPRATDKLT